MSAQSSYRVRLAIESDGAAMAAVEVRAGARFLQSAQPGAAAAAAYDCHSLPSAAAAGRAWVAGESECSVVGFVLVTELGGRAHIEEMDVVPEHGRRGLGIRLLVAACDCAVAAGFSEITLTTYRDVPWNRPYYESMGFRVLTVEERDEALRQLIASEDARGLAREERVVMARAVGDGSAP